uniref:Transmembrane protein n=1 Tax=Trichogramma kaykai TaxID=54128 RepID=A0ABD2XAR0_9HYME
MPKKRAAHVRKVIASTRALLSNYNGFSKFGAFIYTLCACTVHVPYTGATVFLLLCERDFFKKKSYVRETPKRIGTCQVEGFVDLSSQSQSCCCNLTEKERRNLYSLQSHVHFSTLYTSPLTFFSYI